METNNKGGVREIDNLVEGTLLFSAPLCLKF